jgi:signal transduction histidine kinase
MAETTAWEEIRRAEMLRALADLLRKRAVMAPIAIVVISLLVCVESAMWRRGVLLCVVPVMIAVLAVEAVRARRGTLSSSSAGVNAGLMMGGLLPALVATGGIESPGAPAMLIMIVLAGVLASAAAARRVYLTAVVYIVALSIVQLAGWFPDSTPDVFGGDAKAPAPWMIVGRGMTLSVMSTACYLITTRVRTAFERMTERAAAASRALVDGLADENRTLALLTAEIAHELKNPLASVKGLAGLVAKDVDGRTAERVVVLRREVDRMQDVLEQFLTLSRPVVPLELAPVDPRALCDDVAALHEGVAVEGGVRLEVRGARGLAISGDARKLGQVLTNLLQNALAVSPRGSAIVIEASEHQLRVLDEGPGLAAEIAARAFEPGVTTKTDGSGLGLAIARSLARQHGGDVELAPREGGGVAATVRLP